MSVHPQHNHIDEPKAGRESLGLGYGAGRANVFGSWYYYWYFEVPSQ